MNKINASIIIPIIREENILTSLDSFLQSMPKSMEVICVDGSIDNRISRLIENKLGLDTRISVIRYKGTSYGTLLNCGIRYARGIYISVLFPGDIIDIGSYEKILLISLQRNLDFLYTNKKMISSSNEHNEIINPQKDLSWGELLHKSDVRNGLYKRKFLTKHEIYFSEDNGRNVGSIEFCFKTFIHAKRVCIFSSIFYTPHEIDSRGKSYFYADFILQQYDNIQTIIEEKKKVCKIFGNVCFKSMYMKIYELLHTLPKSMLKSFLNKSSEQLRGFHSKIRGDYHDYNPAEYVDIVQLMFSKDHYFENLLQGKTPRMSMEFLFPYHLFSKDSRIVIYGAGNVGRLFYRQAVHDKYVKIIGIVDKHADAMAASDLPVQPIGNLLTMEYDYVLIGIRDSPIAYSVKVNLMDLGIPEKKIKWNGGAYFRDDFINNLYLPMLEKYKELNRGININSNEKKVEKATSTPQYYEFLELVEEKYQKFDLMIFSIIDYRSRHQRPQHIADYFSQRGHRVFYISAGFHPGNGVIYRQEKENLLTIILPNSKHKNVYSTDFSDDGVDLNLLLDQIIYKKGIRDAILLADYPSWCVGICHLKSKFGFPIVVDYMDDYTGFKDTVKPFLKQTSDTLLDVGNAVIASSNYLGEKAKTHNVNVEIIRNGTEYRHFHRAYGKKENGKVIGYYGAIAHWFDFDKIKYLSKRIPNAEIILVGAVTVGEEILKGLPNVKLKGEIPYQELPKYLYEFDVCIIPFDTSTNLIKATNPVKFYEYLSAGKKVVATEIPELFPFKDKFVYLENDDDKFFQCVYKCLTKTDTLLSPQDLMLFAKENDWEVRLSQFSTVLHSLFPKISIVILCYNQLRYTKECIESILDVTAYPNYELIIVDNNSSDGTSGYLKKLKEKYSHIKIVLNQKNRGFAGGNNDGISIASGEYIVLLNNDTVVTRGWLSGMLKWFEDESVGLVGPVTNAIGNEAQISLKCKKELKHVLAAGYVYTAEHIGRDYPHDGYLALYCTMFRKKLIDQIGLLDENYGRGMFEDDDYSMASKRAGYKNLMVEDVFIYHYKSQSFNKLKPDEYGELFEKNRLYYEKKWGCKRKRPHLREYQEDVQK